jgi:AraC-like DNA-binding protein
MGEPEKFEQVTARTLERLAACDLVAMYNFLPNTLVWMKDEKSCYFWVNQKFLLNYSLKNAKSILGKTDYDLNPVYIADLYRADDCDVLGGKSVAGRIEPVQSYDGLVQWFQTWKTPLRDTQNRVVGTLGMTRPLPSNKSPEFPVPELAPVLEYIRHHYDGACSNADLAKLTHLSVRAFERKFRRSFHMTPTQFINRIRITKAAESVCNTSMALVDIADRFGFSDQSHFTREFRRYFGETPKAYRQSHMNCS